MFTDDSIPVSTLDKDDFTRDEREGSLLIIKNGTSYDSAIIVNRIGREILEASDGRHTISQTANKLSRKYLQVSPLQIAKDVRDFVEHLRKLQLIKYSEDGDMYNGKNIGSIDGWTIHRCGEGDYQRVVEALEGDKCVNTSSAAVTDGDYSPLPLRARLFNYAEEFFILTQGDANVALFSILTSRSTPNNMSSVGKLILHKPLETAIVTSFIRKSAANFKDELEPECRRVRFSARIHGERLEGRIAEILNGSGFELTAVLKKEYEDGSNQIILDYHLPNGCKTTEKG